MSLQTRDLTVLNDLCFLVMVWNVWSSHLSLPSARMTGVEGGYGETGERVGLGVMM